MSFTGGRKTSKSDVYSLSMMIVELLCPGLKYPWQGTHSQPLLADTINLKISEAVKVGERPTVAVQETDSVTLGLIALMKSCWHQNPHERPTAKELQKPITDLSIQVTKLNIKKKLWR